MPRPVGLPGTKLTWTFRENYVYNSTAECLNRSNIPYHRAGKYTTDSFEFLIRGFLDSNPGKGRGGRDLRLEDGHLLLYGLNLIEHLAYLLYNQVSLKNNTIKVWKIFVFIKIMCGYIVNCLQNNTWRLESSWVRDLVICKNM